MGNLGPVEILIILGLLALGFVGLVVLLVRSGRR
jgi:hypothetical protein